MKQDGRSVRLGLLGPFSLRVDGTAVDLARGSQRLLALLALRKATDRRTIAGTLWPDGAEERATANLRAAIWRLPDRGRRLVQARRGLVALDPAVECDLRTLERRALGLLEADGPAMSVVELAGLSEDLLPDWDEDWLVIEREWIRQLALQALDVLADRLKAAGRVAEAVLAAVLAVRSDPLRESSQRLLIAAHEANHNRCLAIRQYDQYRILLREELGVEPSFPRPLFS